MKTEPESVKPYQLSIKQDMLVLTTNSFRAEKGSVLHSGIFSRELASSFVGASVALLYLLSVYILSGVSIIQFGIAAGLFALATLLSRIYLFKETYLETRIDREGITIRLNRPLFKRFVKRGRNELRDIKIEHKRFEPENPDAVEFVEKIALQHGTVIPGFGKVKEFFSLVLDFGDESYTVLTLEDRDEIQRVMVKLKDFLKKEGDK